MWVELCMTIWHEAETKCRVVQLYSNLCTENYDSSETCRCNYTKQIKTECFQSVEIQI
jgi:hypothetical protein